MPRGLRFHQDERGAILIHVAMGVLAIAAFTSFVIDYGVLWVSRRHAQNSADAAALAGAVAYAYDSQSRLDTGPPKLNAYHVSQQNLVWDGPPSVFIPTDITFPVCPDDPTFSCIRVDVHRSTARGNPLPTFFGRLVGLMAQDIRATATAEILPGNASDCLKPWGIPDKWLEIHPTPGTWDPGDTFDKYYPQGRQTGAPLPVPDIYIPPTKTNPGTGFTLLVDKGLQLTLKPGDPQQATSPGWYFALTLTTPGGAEYRNNIANCSGTIWGIGDEIPVEPGNMIGPTRQGTLDLIALDRSAQWDSVNKRVINSCVGPPYTCSYTGWTESPRIVQVPVFNTEAYEDGRQSGRLTIKVVNILGFFIESVSGNDVVGYLINSRRGIHNPNLLTPPGPSAFTTSIILIR